LVTLDGVERVLGRNPRSGEPVDDCLICDADGGPVGVAGIMGGASSEIGPGTTRVLLEAAYFTPMAVARTSRRLGLRTEASARFERGCDPEGIERAVARFCQLAGGPDGSWARAWPGALAAGHSPARPRIRLRTARVNAILGTDLSDDQVRGYLAPIGFTAAPVEPGVAEVEVPSWRPDSEREIDLIEEVARHHGYGAIPRTRPVSPRVGGLTPYQRERRRVRATLVGLGASEAWTSSLVSPEDHQRVGLDSPGVELDNPLAREESVLRMTLLPGLLRAIDGNAAHRDGDVRLFEVGRVFAPPRGGGELPEEREVVALALARPGDDARGAVSAWRSLAQALRLAPVDLEAAALPGLHPGRGARLAGAAGDAGPAGPVASEGPSPQAGLAGAVGGAGPAGSAGPVGAGAPAGPGVGLGVVGEVDPAVLEAFGLGGRRVGWLELDLGVLARLPRQPEEARAVSRYPSAEFDLAFVVEDTVPAGAVGTTLASAGTGAGGELVVGVVLFDVYRGDQLGPGRRSVAYRLRLGALDHTLGEEELAGIRARCIEAVEESHRARLRG
ncbi:MAG: phenylalanine--tRNA ligase subunit beta, partial [Acidimicrobiales bacterium]